MLDKLYMTQFFFIGTYIVHFILVIPNDIVESPVHEQS
jgi:hypothetical protein